MLQQNAPWRAALAAAALALFAGCTETQTKEAAPPTHPVTGRVLMKNGTPMKSAMVEFTAAEAVEGPDATGQLIPALGRTDDNGNYKLSIRLADGTPVEGAMPGKYKVIVSPDAGSDQTQFDAFQPIEIAGTFTVEEKANKIDITLPK